MSGRVVRPQVAPALRISGEPGLWGRAALLSVVLFAVGWWLVQSAGVMADLLAFIFFLLTAVWLTLKIGRLGSLVAVTALVGHGVYSFLTIGVASDARAYYLVGHEYLSTGVPPLNFGTEFMYFLSHAVQNWLPVSLYGLAWLFLGIKLLILPNVQKLPVKADIFFLLMSTAPNVVIWTGLFSKDLLSSMAILLSVGAFAALRQGKAMVWLIMVAAGIAIEVGVRPYMVPMILVPHLVVMWLHLYGVLLRSRFQRLPLGAALLLPLAVAGAGAAFPLVTQYIGIQELSQIGERIEKMSVDLASGTTAVILTPAEKVFLLAAPTPFRIRNPLMLMVSLVSLGYLLWLAVLLFRLRYRGGWLRLDGGLMAFCITGLALWTFAYWGTSNMGALERLKGQILPYLFLLMAHVAWAARDNSGTKTYTSPFPGFTPLRYRQPTKLNDFANQPNHDVNQYR